MTNIFGLNLTELTSLITDLNLPKFRAKQIIEWLYQKHATSFDEIDQSFQRFTCKNWHKNLLLNVQIL